MSSLGTSKGILEIAKFGVYVSVPVALTYLVATDSKTLKKLMGLVSSSYTSNCLSRSLRDRRISCCLCRCSSSDGLGLKTDWGSVVQWYLRHIFWPARVLGDLDLDDGTPFQCATQRCQFI